MRVLLLNQAFYPDIVSTAQHAADLARSLAGAGHAVTVVASRRGYDDPARRLPRRETWQGIRILRVPCPGFGKGARWRRAGDFAGFLASCLVRLLVLPRFDVVIAMTTPPLLSVLAAWFVRLRGGRLVVWSMDLNPDEAIAGGWLRPGAAVARLLGRLQRYSLAAADRIVALDRYMLERIAAKGVDAAKISVIPPWSHDGSVCYDEPGREAFRRAHGLEDKFVVMYSGNHSPCHPLDTLLEAAARLAARTEIAFCFVGGGSEFRKVERFAAERRPAGVRCLPYQPLDRLSASLSAADLHVVAMGDAFVGIVHPCKVYNILALGIPFLYIGPTRSHVMDLAAGGLGDWARAAAHGDAGAVAAHILDSARRGPRRSEAERRLAGAFSERVLAGAFRALCESIGETNKEHLCKAVQESS